MDTALLKHLGVNETIVRALEKSWGEKIDELEIEQGHEGLRLILRSRRAEGVETQIISLKNETGFLPPAVSDISPDYKAAPKEHYRCMDRLILYKPADSLSPNVALNGQAFRLGDSLFKLLAYFAQRLKDGGHGWVSIQDLRAARVIPSEGYQVFSRLRSVVAGYLLRKNPREFIEASGSKEYRLSVPPAHVFFDR